MQDIILGAYEYLSGSTQHTNSKQHLIGYLLAYEFTSKDTTELAKRIDYGKKIHFHYSK